MSTAWNLAMGRRARQRRRERNPHRVAAQAPWQKVVWIGKRKGSQGGSIYHLVLECGHLAIRPCVEPAEHRIFRRMPGAPKKCRCLNCKLGMAKADPQIWIDTLTRIGAEP